MFCRFEPQRAVQQLRACGVLETVRLSAAGYPSRWTYNEFFQRYRLLLRSGQVRRDDVRQMCEYILHRSIKVSQICITHIPFDHWDRSSVLVNMVQHQGQQNVCCFQMSSQLVYSTYILQVFNFTNFGEILTANIWMVAVQ